MEHFSLSRSELVALGRSAVDCVFGPTAQKDRVNRLLDDFAEESLT